MPFFVFVATVSCASVTLEPGRTEVVIAKKAPPAVRFAVDELTNVLSRVLGAAVPVVNVPTDGRASLVLGVNEWSQAAGIDVSARPRDTYVIKTCGSRIHLVGRDDPRQDPWRSPRIQSGLERATSFAALPVVGEIEIISIRRHRIIYCFACQRQCAGGVACSGVG